MEEGAVSGEGGEVGVGSAASDAVVGAGVCQVSDLVAFCFVRGCLACGSAFEGIRGWGSSRSMYMYDTQVNFWVSGGGGGDQET